MYKCYLKGQDVQAGLEERFGKIRKLLWSFPLSLMCEPATLTKGSSIANTETKLKRADKKHSEQHEEKWERKGETNALPKYIS